MRVACGKLILFLFGLLCVAPRLGAQASLDSARLALHLGQLPKARGILEPAYKASPADTAVVLLLAEVYLREQEPKRAEQLLNAALAGQPECGELYVRLGIALNMRGKFPKAEEAFLRANTLLADNHPARATLYVNLGLAVMSDARAQEAVPWFERAIAFTPRNATAYGYKGMALYRAGDAGRAIEAYDRALEIDETNAIIRYNRGVAHQRNDDQAKACLDDPAACKLGNMNACKKVMMECSKQN